MFWQKMGITSKMGSLQDRQGALICNSGMWCNRANYVHALFVSFFSLSLNYLGSNCYSCIVRGHGGRSGHLVLFLVALSFSKLETFLNNIPEGNPLKSVYLTPKIALKFRRIGCRNGRLVTIAICFSHSLFRATKLVFMANYSYCRGA